MATGTMVPNGFGQQNAAMDPAAINSVVEQLRKLRTTIAAGQHPRFKRPQQIVPGEPSGNLAAVSSLSGTNAKAPASNPIPATPQTNVPSTQSFTAPNSMPAKVKEPDPRAILQQKRQELERVLEKQLQEKRLLHKQRTCDAELVADFDISEVLRKAHELVKPWKSNDTHSTNGSRASSDSFDENTFYSSQMNESSTTEEVEHQPNLQHPDRPCNFFQNGKPCPYGDKCIYSHDPAVAHNAGRKPNQPAARTKDQGNRRAKSPVRPAPPVAPAADRQASKIAKLEEQLRQLKEQQRSKPAVVARAVERQDSPPSGNVVGGVDEFGRDKSRREQFREEPKDLVRIPTPYVSNPYVSKLTYTSPSQQPVQVVRNHITSPYAPQPARVSPLTGIKPPQIPNVQRVDNQNGTVSNNVNDRVQSARQSPAMAGQPRNAKRRRDLVSVEESARNVVPRREQMASPVIRIKEEPVSPPPLGASIPQARRVSGPQNLAATPRIREQSLQDDEDGGYVFHAPVQEQRPITPRQRRVVSSGHRFPAEKVDLRRVVSTKNLQAPPSPDLDAQFLDSRSRPRPMRIASQVQYVSEQPPPVQYRASVQPQLREHAQQYVTEQPVNPQYRASVQPQIREYVPQPQQINMTSERRHSMTIAPPTRRIVVDQFGNRYMEAPVPSEQSPTHVPVARQIALDPQYEQLSPGGSRIIRRAQPQQTFYEDDSQYIQRVSSPASPQYIEYPTSANSSTRRRHQIIRLDDDYDDQPPPPKIVRYENQPRTVVQYDDSSMNNGFDDTNQHVRVQRVQRMPDHQQYDPLPPSTPREQMSRVGSVRPQPRIVRLGEQQEESNPRLIRQVSISRPDDSGGYVSRVQRVPPPPLPPPPQGLENGQGHGEYQRAFVDQGHHDGMYGQRAGSRVVRLE